MKKCCYGHYVESNNYICWAKHIEGATNHSFSGRGSRESCSRRVQGDWPRGARWRPAAVLCNIHHGYIASLNQCCTVFESNRWWITSCREKDAWTASCVTIQGCHSSTAVSSMSSFHGMPSITAATLMAIVSRYEHDRMSFSYKESWNNIYVMRRREGKV